MASEVLILVVENSSLLNSPTSLKSKVGDAWGQFSNPPKVEGKLTLINYTLWELTERINPFFSTRKLEWAGAGSQVMIS